MNFKELIDKWRDYYSQKSELINAGEPEFKAFLFGIQIGALHSNNMEFYNEVCKIIDSYQEEK